MLHGASPRLTVHTIDTFHGMAATGLRIDFSRFDGEVYVPVRSFTINANGRADEPLLIDDSYRAGRYELLLHVDEYFAAKGARLPARPSSPRYRCASRSPTWPSAFTCRSSSVPGATPIRAAAEPPYRSIATKEGQPWQASAPMYSTSPPVAP